MAKKTILGDTSYKETKFGILPRRKVIQLEAKGTKQGLILLKSIAEKHNPITVSFILKIHKASFSDILTRSAGAFRSIQVTYSGKEAPHFSRVHELMKNLCDDTEYVLTQLPDPNDDTYIKRVIELLAFFQHRFLAIHPFVDYNGRVARMFTSYLVMQLNLPIMEIPVKTRNERDRYIRALQSADNSDYVPLQNIISKALNESLQKIQAE